MEEGVQDVFRDIDTRFGRVRVVGRPRGQLRRVLMPSAKLISKTNVRAARADELVEIAGLVQASLDGSIGDTERVLRVLDFESLSSFRQQVYRTLLLDGPPRGKVISYQSLARRMKKQRAIRAVGTALARNPVPLVVPCHRVVRTDRKLGGFAGTQTGEPLTLKRQLLEAEGVRFSPDGKVQPESIYSS